MDENSRPNIGLGTLLGDFLRFQVKLAVDALRDLVLIPLTWFAVVADVLLLHRQPPRFFYWMLSFGERSERLLDLWSALYERYAPPPDQVDAAMVQIGHAVRHPRQGARRARVLRRWAGMRIGKMQRRRAGDVASQPASTDSVTSDASTSDADDPGKNA